MTELATGRYATFDPSMGVPVRITAGAPKFPLGYELKHQIRRLAPRGLMGLGGDDFVAAYRERLDRLDLAALVQRFEAISDQEVDRRLVLLCFEDVHAGQLCHRRVFAEWFEERTGQRVPEIPARSSTRRSGQLSLDDCARRPKGQLTPEAREAVQAALNREAQRMLEAGYRRGPDGRLHKPAPGTGAQPKGHNDGAR